MQSDENDLEKLYSSWSNEDLIKSVTMERNNFTEDAVVLMGKILTSRGIPYEKYDQLKEEIIKKIELMKDLEQTRKAQRPFKLSVALGLFPALQLFAVMVGDPGPKEGFVALIESVIIISLVYGSFGAVFGFLRPMKSWKGGVWVYIPSFFIMFPFSLLSIVSFATGRWEVDLVSIRLFGIPFVAFAAGCIGAYVGARFALWKRARGESPGNK